MEEATNDLLVNDSSSSSSCSTFAFDERPKKVLVLKKPHSEIATQFLQTVVSTLHKHGIESFVEQKVFDEISSSPRSQSSLPLCSLWNPRTSFVDFIIAIGGDGTLLHANSLFPLEAPPVLSFNFGSLGFLSPFSPEDLDSALSDILSLSAMKVCNRHRLSCIIHNEEGSHERISLNEITVNRGVNSMCTAEVFINDIFVTKIDSDGVIIATSTGSTAYSLSAGGTIVHPSLPALLLTPICPHSLTSRPIILPHDVRLKVKIPLDSRAGAVACVDGATELLLRKGDWVEVTSSPYPFPCFVRDCLLEDWIFSLSQCLSWNAERRNRNEKMSKKSSNL
jgi:NAD kinase